MHKGLKAILVAVVVVPLVLVGGPAFALAPTPPSTTPGSLQNFELGVPGGLLGAAETSPQEGAQSANESQYDWAAGESEFEPPASAGSAPSNAGGALLAATVVWGMRGGIAQGVDSIFGINASQTVCQAASSLGGWAELVEEDGDDQCPSIAQQNSDFVQNALENGVTAGAKACDASGLYCVQLDSNNGVGYQSKGFWCYATSGLGSGNATIIVDETGGGVLSQSFAIGQSAPGYCNADNETGDVVPGDISVGIFAPVPHDYCVIGPTDTLPAPLTCAGLPGNAVVGNSKNDPPRTLRCDVTATDGHIYSAFSGSFLESDGSFPNPVCPALPGTVQPQETKIWEVTSGEPDQLLDDLPSTSAFNSWAATAPAPCLQGKCVLDVVSTSIPQTDCNATPDATACADWFTDPNRDADWECTYGGTVTAMSDCYVLSQFFKPTALQSGQLYADPLTGDPVDGQTSALPGTIAPGTPVQDPESTRSCFPSGWGALNPVNWVLQPVICALQWAFVPRASVVKADGKAFKTAVAASAVGAVLGILSGMATFPIHGDGCSGIPWHFQIFTLDQTYYLLAACPGDPLAPTAAVVKAILTAVVVTVGVLTSARYIANIFGYIGYGGVIDADRRQEYRDEARERRTKAVDVRFK